MSDRMTIKVVQHSIEDLELTDDRSFWIKCHTKWAKMKTKRTDSSMWSVVTVVSQNTKKIQAYNIK